MSLAFLPCCHTYQRLVSYALARMVLRDRSHWGRADLEASWARQASFYRLIREMTVAPNTESRESSYDCSGQSFCEERRRHCARLGGCARAGHLNRSSFPSRRVNLCHRVSQSLHFGSITSLFLKPSFLDWWSAARATWHPWRSSSWSTPLTAAGDAHLCYFHALWAL